MSKQCFVIGLIAFLGLIVGCAAVVPATAAAPLKVVKSEFSTADHGHFKELDQEFSSGSEVTRACLKCHNLAASQVHNTIHWTWAGRQGDKKGEGKAVTLNNF